MVDRPVVFLTVSVWTHRLQMTLLIPFAINYGSQVESQTLEIPFELESIPEGICLMSSVRVHNTLSPSGFMILYHFMSSWLPRRLCVPKVRRQNRSELRNQSQLEACDTADRTVGGTGCVAQTFQSAVSRTFSLRGGWFAGSCAVRTAGQVWRPAIQPTGLSAVRVGGSAHGWSEEM